MPWRTDKPDQDGLYRTIRNWCEEDREPFAKEVVAYCNFRNGSWYGGYTSLTLAIREGGAMNNTKSSHQRKIWDRLTAEEFFEYMKEKQ